MKLKFWGFLHNFIRNILIIFNSIEDKVWKQTGEKVCYDCRVDFLDQEFREQK